MADSAKGDATIMMRVGSDVKSGFKAAADLSGLTLTGWILQRCRAACEEELDRYGQPVPYLPKKPRK